MEEHSWVTYENTNAAARKRVEAGTILVNLTLNQVENKQYNLMIEAGIESVSVTLHSINLEKAMEEADGFAREYFLDRAKLLEEIAQRI